MEFQYSGEYAIRLKILLYNNNGNLDVNQEGLPFQLKDLSSMSTTRSSDTIEAWSIVMELKIEMD